MRKNSTRESGAATREKSAMVEGGHPQMEELLELVLLSECRADPKSGKDIMNAFKKSRAPRKARNAKNMNASKPPLKKTNAPVKKAISKKSSKPLNTSPGNI